MKKRILIVDPALIMRTMLRDVCEGAGHHVVGEARAAEEAVVQYKDLKPDVVTIELRLASSDGMAAIRDILAYDRQAHVVVISALDQRKILMEAIMLGVRDYILKPFDSTRVLNAIAGGGG